MPTDLHSGVRSSGRLWTGRVLTGLVVLFLALDGLIKMIKAAPAVEASAQLGLPPESVVGIGLVLLTCVTVYVIPRTAVLGAILLTGYLGGAMAIHVRASSGAFPILFSLGFGVLVWVGLALREPRLTRLILRREFTPDSERVANSS